MLLSQTKVVDYIVKWLENRGWKIIFAHYPEGHHISPDYGELKIIKRKYIDIIAMKGTCLFLIQCNKRFKETYFEKLKGINPEDIDEIKFKTLLKGVAFNIIPSHQKICSILKEGGIVFEVKAKDNIILYGKIPKECEGNEYA